jgi:hypothetical protein
LKARRTQLAALAAIAVIAGSGCGDERQDADEPEGDFAVEVEASFPEKQRLAQRSSLRLRVRNAGDRTIPNIAVIVDGFSYAKDDPALADPERPQFVVNGVPVEIGGFPEAKEAAPRGCDTAYVDTWACGPLRPGRERTFRWTVTAVEAGRFDGVEVDECVVVEDGRVVLGDESHPAHVRSERIDLIHVPHGEERVVPAPQVEELELVGVDLRVLRALEVHPANPVPPLLQVGDEMMADEASRPGH